MQRKISLNVAKLIVLVKAPRDFERLMNITSHRKPEYFNATYISAYINEYTNYILLVLRKHKNTHTIRIE